MAYDEELADRIRVLLDDRPSLTESFDQQLQYRLAGSRKQYLAR